MAERLQGRLHLPAVKEALRCLIPEALDSALDAHHKKALRGDSDRVGVKLSAKGLGVDVSAESVLRAGRPMHTSVLEFFLIVFATCATSWGFLLTWVHTSSASVSVVASLWIRPAR